MPLSNVLLCSIVCKGRRKHFRAASPQLVWEFHWWSAEETLLNDWNSQQGSMYWWRAKTKAWKLRSVIQTLVLRYFRRYLAPIWIAPKQNKMATDDMSPDNVKLAELAPGRLNRISQFKSNTKFAKFTLNFGGLNLNE